MRAILAIAAALLYIAVAVFLVVPVLWLYFTTVRDFWF